MVATLSTATGGTNVNMVEEADLGLAPGVNATFADYLAEATAGDGSINAIVSGFEFDGSTYVVTDATAAAGYTAATDFIVELTGTVDLTEFTYA